MKLITLTRKGGIDLSICAAFYCIKGKVCTFAKATRDKIKKLLTLPLHNGLRLSRKEEIMFFRELEIPLIVIKKIMDNPNYDKEQALLAQKSLLEQKRIRLNR